MPLESRQRILEHLKKSGQASVAELSQTLTLTSVTIRHHLAALRSEGLVAEPVSRHRPGPGRPEMVYQIASAADELMPRNYGELCRCLIQAVESRQTSDLEGVLAEMGSSLGASANAVGNTAVVRSYLEDRGYFPSVEKDEGTIILKLANCPYLELARSAPSLCEFDRALIGALFGREVEVAGLIVNQEPVCAFHINY
ncbi:MAG: helix-turn-helix transcriptional regulator [Anaerolineales bacterium]